jgi:lipopolysaccharide export system protein LptA
MVLVAGVLLLAAMAAFLVRAKLKNLVTGHDLPHRLALNIQQEAKEFTLVHAYGAHSQFRIHASREVQLRDNRVQLHDVQIELYGADGSRVDEITGDTFDYDQKSGLVIAEGPVEMVLTRPPAAPGTGAKDLQTLAVANPAGQIHLKTSGVTFDRDTGMVATAKPVNFTMAQGSGNAVGAMFDSQNGYLTLDHAVELTMRRGGEPVEIGALHAECDRDSQVCTLRGAKVDYRGGKASAAEARIEFRADGTAEQLDATSGFTAETATGGHLTAPTAQMDFSEHNQPLQGHLEGGVTMDSANGGQSMQGSAPAAELMFTAQGQLKQAEFEQGVVFNTQETNQASTGEAEALEVKRTWRSPQAEVNFKDGGKGRVELDNLHGTGGVVVTSESRRGAGAAMPARMSADQVTGTFAQGSALHSLTGTGHASIEETSATGARQTASGDRLTAEFKDQVKDPKTELQGSRGSAQASGTADLQSAELDGHVVVVEHPAAHSGAQAQPPIHASAGKAEYEQTGQWVHLTINPRIESNGLELTADKVDVSQQSGDAFAHGNVKATWINTGAGGTGGQNAAASKTGGEGPLSFGGKGAAHVVAEDAEMNQSTGEATFRGGARLWQVANSVSAPLIVLNQHLQTLVARSSEASDPVKLALMSAGGPGAGLGANNLTGRKATSKMGAGPASAGPAAAEVIRLRGGDLWYSQAEDRAVIRRGVLGAVVAETATATSSSDEVDLRLMPAAKQEGASGGQTEVDRILATGHVVLTSQDRQGTGEQLAYSSVTRQYVLTGTAKAPPKLTAPGRGTVSGEALIFNSGDDSVSIEGAGHETITETTAPEVHVK